MFMKTNNMINNFSVVIPVFNEEEIFLNSAKKWLIDTKCKPIQNNTPTTVPNNYKFHR